VECGKAQFSLKKKRFTLFDAPGHKNYVPNMIMGACQSDIAILVISAKTGEYEAGFTKGGQTQEHALLAKSLGVEQLVIVVSKMDTVNWDQKRFNSIKSETEHWIKLNCNFDDIQYVPIDGLNGLNISSRMNPNVCNWYAGKCLFDTLDEAR
jgi:peptide chain release factor subunit 3